MSAAPTALPIPPRPIERLSPAERLALLPVDERRTILGDLSETAREALLSDWQFWGRPDQQEPAGDWDVWGLIAGRGYGKTRTGSETVHRRVRSGRSGRLALVAPTAADVRDVMIEGESGILATAPNGHRPIYEPSKRRVTWPNGATGHTYSAEEPDRLRGPQHDFAWWDEPATCRYGETAWSNLRFGLRLGTRPQAMLTTTPRRVAWLVGSGRTQTTDKRQRGLLNAPGCVITRGTTYDNVANLPESFITDVIERFEGTRLGRQELHAEVLFDVEGALWTYDLLDRQRISPAWDDDGLLELPPMKRVVVAVDPSVTSGGDECGILVCGLGIDNGGYVLDDVSRQGSPNDTISAAIDAYESWGADAIIAEVNNGGEYVETVLRTLWPTAPYRAVHASRGKRARAEPVATYYERGRAWHVGQFPKLEDEQTGWNPKESPESPNRLDAVVWGLSDLWGIGKGKVRILR